MGSALHHQTLGAGPRLVLVSGFTQTAACWRGIADDLARDHEVVLVDPPGHGGSGDRPLDLWQAADALVAAAGRATYVGYSMGGRMCLHAALARPDLVHALVVVGTTAGLRSPTERATRRAADARLAEQLETSGVRAFVDAWLENPLFEGLTADTDCRQDRYRNTSAGLASSLRLAGVGSQDDLWPRLGELSMPTLVVAGEHDPKFRAIGARLAEEIAGPAGFVVMDGTHHAAPFEQPDAFITLLRGWTALDAPASG